jgi:hypothetical protein
MTFPCRLHMVQCSWDLNVLTCSSNLFFMQIFFLTKYLHKQVMIPGRSLKVADDGAL